MYKLANCLIETEECWTFFNAEDYIQIYSSIAIIATLV